MPVVCPFVPSGEIICATPAEDKPHCEAIQAWPIDVTRAHILGRQGYRTEISPNTVQSWEAGQPSSRGEATAVVMACYTALGEPAIKQAIGAVNG